MNEKQLNDLYKAASNPDIIQGVFARLFGAFEGELSGEHSGCAKWAIEKVQQALDRENAASQKFVPGGQPDSKGA